ncbi:MarR family winged helix-turn-helix transcriptional regulator [Modestobacter sp. SYSU DS0875]
MDPSVNPTDLTDDVGFLLSRASGLIVRANNAALAPHGLRVRSYSVLLLACGATDGVSQRDLAEVLGRDPSQVVLLVDELASMGLVRRQRSESDRRTNLVRATPAGQALRAETERLVRAAVAQQLKELTPTEQFLLRDLLSRIALGKPGAVPA